MNYSVVISESINCALLKHLIRADYQEDLCFALYAPSSGSTRYSGVIKEIILPELGDRRVHGNVSFYAHYLDRVTSLALRKRLGVCFLHSHPGPGWQGMSRDDINAEKFLAPRVQAITNYPLLGMTTGSDGSWSARYWIRVSKGQYKRHWCNSVRVVGKAFTPHHKPGYKTHSINERSLERTISAWGIQKQSLLSRLTVGVVGLGSVGGQIAEALVKTGICQIKLFDFDSIELKNIDRLTGAGPTNVGLSKIAFYSNYLSHVSPNTSLSIETYSGSITEPKSLPHLLDCDIIFSCVDRPYPRYILNQIAYANSIPVIDGGIDTSINRTRDNIQQARWRSTIAGPERICLECFGQYAPEDVALEMDGMLDDPVYVKGLPEDHFAKKGENVYVFSLNAAGNMMLQFLSLTLQPMGIYYGPKEMNFTTGTVDSDFPITCRPSCITSHALAMGDHINNSLLKKTVNHTNNNTYSPKRNIEVPNRIWAQIWRYLQELKVFNRA